MIDPFLNFTMASSSLLLIKKGRDFYEVFLLSGYSDEMGICYIEAAKKGYRAIYGKETSAH
jgi:hypothetical protein